MTIDHALRELVREATQLAIRDELPSILKDALKRFDESDALPKRPSNPALSTDQAAEYAGVSPATIRAKISCRELRAVRVGRVFKVRRSDLDAFLARSGPREDGVIDLTVRAHEILASTRHSSE
jgi:excisionase family DNA binding protein